MKLQNRKRLQEIAGILQEVNDNSQLKKLDVKKLQKFMGEVKKTRDVLSRQSKIIFRADDVASSAILHLEDRGEQIFYKELVFHKTGEVIFYDDESGFHPTEYTTTFMHKDIATLDLILDILREEIASR